MGDKEDNKATNGFEEALGIVVDGTGIYVVGYDVSAPPPPSLTDLPPNTPLPPPNREWRIEKRDRTNGDLVTFFGNGGVITSNLSNSFDQATDIAIDSSGIFIVGYDTAPSAPLLGNTIPPIDQANSQWRIEKRDSTSGSLITSFNPTGNTKGVVTNNPGIGLDDINSIDLDASGIYVAGNDSSSGRFDLQWRIEKRELADGELVWAETSHRNSNIALAQGLVADNSGV